MVPTANWSYPTSVWFGAGRIAELPSACSTAGITKPLLVTDAGLADLPPTRKALSVLQDAGLSPALFADVKSNPTDANLEAGRITYRDGGHDGVVAFGGGSGIDLGKLVAFMAGQSRPVWDFEDVGDWWTRADASAIAPIVAVPTTAGTGSEVGRASVLTNTETHVKKIIFHPRILPTVVIADPELTIGMPKTITAGTGMDALAHGLEAYCAPNYHPMSEGIALQCIRLVHDNLPRVLNDPQDLEARAHMLSAAMMGAVAFQRGLGGVHALSHPIGAIYDTHHGMTNAVFLPYVLSANRSAIEERISRLSAYLGIAGEFDGFMAWLLAMREMANVPHTLAGLGLDDARFDEIAAMALEDPSAGGNPVPMTRDSALQILRMAYDGALAA